METYQKEKTREKVGEKNHGEGKLKEPQEAKSPASPASVTSSPSHEFSFAISLHSSSNPSSDKSKTPPSIAIDLSPADDIFFHGHLLPLHFLSHLPVSPRSSTNSMDSFTLPIREFLDDHRRADGNCSTSNGNTNKHHRQQSSNFETKGRSKLKSFSLFGLKRWQQKGDKAGDIRDGQDKQKRKLRFDVSHVLKRYMRLVRPLLFFRERRGNLDLRRQPYSFSGNLFVKDKHDLRGMRGEYSAPASMRTSPTNSGLLVATTANVSSTSDSTMEELQAAIQAAIAHCKNSIGLEDKIKC